MSNQFTGKEFYRFVISAIEAHHSDECLIWTGDLGGRGYPQIRIDGKKIRLNRFAFKFAHGAYPVNCALHTCDNPRCYNPRHIYDGDRHQNAKDREARNPGKQPKGINQHGAKLNDEKIVIIRRMYAQGNISQQAIADIYGVTQTVIGHAITRRTWKHVE